MATPYHPKVASRFFGQAAEKVMLPPIRLHDVRHTRATVSITLDTYSHAIPAMQQAAALIAGLVFAED